MCSSDLQTFNLSSGGEKRSRLAPCGTTRVVLGTNEAASGVVEMTPSILLISHLGNQECRCFAADVKTIEIGRRKTSLKNIDNIISGSLRTCQMRFRPSGNRLHESLIASIKDNRVNEFGFLC